MTILNIVDNVEYPIDALVDEVNEALKNRELTFDQAVLMHQLMWSWIYEEFRCWRKVDKKDFWEQNHLLVDIGQMQCFCFFCIYRRFTAERLLGGMLFNCDYCIGRWGSEDSVAFGYCEAYPSVFLQYNREVKHSSQATPEHLEILEKIAKIPIRKKEEYDI